VCFVDCNERSGPIKGLSEVVFGDCNETSGFIKVGYFLDQMGDYRLLKKELLSQSWLGMFLGLSNCSFVCLKFYSLVGRLLLPGGYSQACTDSNGERGKL